jgi:hypothetical protein
VNTLTNVRTNARSPLAVAVLFIGLAVFAIVAIVRATLNTGSDIDTTTSAGLAAVKAPAMSNNIADALPAFSIQKPLDATVVSVYDNQAKGVTLIQVGNADNLDWLSVTYGPDGERWVNGGAWFDCRRIDASVLTYAATSKDDYALFVWGELAPRQQSEIAKECQP